MSSILGNIDFRHLEPHDAKIARLIADSQAANSAKAFASRLIREMRKFESELDDNHEVAVRLVTFGQAITFHVSALGYIDPSLVVFHGYTDSNEPVELIQHVNQISFLLMRALRLDPAKPKQQIGFING